MDLPIGRTKPPNNKYLFDDIISIISRNKNVRYFAFLNVNSSNDAISFIGKIPSHVTLVPKIQSPDGVANIDEITKSIGDEKIIMLDHDDLLSNLVKRNESPDKFKEYISNLTNFCTQNNVILLRTIGLMFTDEERRVTQYMK